MKKINLDEILLIHEQMIDTFGGTNGIRDKRLLESAIQSPYHTYSGIDIFNSIEEKAARLGFGIIYNHPFIDGNKRTGIHCMLLLLLINDINLDYSQKELWEIALKIANNGTYDDLLKWIKNHKII